MIEFSCMNCRQPISNKIYPKRWKFCKDWCSRQYHLRKSMEKRDAKVINATIDKIQQGMRDDMVEEDATFTEECDNALRKQYIEELENMKVK